MSANTAIQYADSSLNLMMGCEGCELWSKTDRACYAGIQTLRYGGMKGWPRVFSEPTIFPERIKQAQSWQNMAGRHREDKPWIPRSMPRIVFLNDMGDTFSSKLKWDWFAEYLPILGATPHIYLVLTKRPSRFSQLSEKYTIPSNIWPGTTITTDRTLQRMEHLLNVRGGGPKWLSVEPMRGPVEFGPRFIEIDWCVFGGESKQDGAQEPVPFEIEWLREGIDQCRAAGVAPFVKQMGSDPRGLGVTLSDPHGGNWLHWPPELRVREYPALNNEQKTLL